MKQFHFHTYLESPSTPEGLYSTHLITTETLPEAMDIFHSLIPAESYGDLTISHGEVTLFEFTPGTFPVATPTPEAMTEDGYLPHQEALTYF